MMNVICFLKGHTWSQWYSHVERDKQYHYCYRCGEIEYRTRRVVQANPEIISNPSGNFKRPISFGKPSFLESLEIANREASEKWYSKIPRDELNDAIKCLANELSRKDFDTLGLFFVGCGRCRNRLFCSDIMNSIRKALKKYAQ